ncbi:MAG: ABC transporter ATP-binding protein [Planctomycetota bacterium]|jgi:molybdopterin-binding protein
MLRVKDISKAFDGNLIIKDVSFEVSEGQYFVLLGSSGVGKSLLFETIAGAIYPDTGQIFLDGTDITAEKIQERKIGLVFQDNVLFPHMRVYENVAYPLKCRKMSGPQIEKRVMKLADDFGFTSLLKRKPSTLSGGESQRVSLARAVASEPRCLLLDEPLSSLDVSSRPEIRALLRKMNSHIFQRPKSEFIAHFVGIRNFFKGQLKKTLVQESNLREFITVEGISFSVLVDSDASNGYVMIRSEDVTVSGIMSESSARNRFEATIVDIVRAGPGVEVIVDIGQKKAVEIAAMVTTESTKELGLKIGEKVWISFKASAAKYIEE